MNSCSPLSSARPFVLVKQAPQWVIGEKQVSVWNDPEKESLHLAKTIRDPAPVRKIRSEHPPGWISNNLYASAHKLFAVLRRFRDVIAANLQEVMPFNLEAKKDLTEEVGCCVPSLYDHAWTYGQEQPIQHVMVALFGHLAKDAQGQPIIDRAWWGISDETTGICSRLPIVDITASLEKYLVDTLVHGHPMHIYEDGKRLKVIAKLGPNNRIESMALAPRGERAFFLMQQVAVIEGKQISIWNHPGEESPYKEESLHLVETAKDPALVSTIEEHFPSLKQGGRPPGQVSRTLFADWDKLRSILRTFQNVIEANLQAVMTVHSKTDKEKDLTEEVGCCVPSLYDHVWTARNGSEQSIKHIMVALFGHVVKNAQGQPIIDRAWWGSLNTTTGICNRLPIAYLSASVKEYLMNTLVHKYPVSIYGKRVKVIATLGPDDGIKSLTLTLFERMSLFDLNRPLDERNWAVSLIYQRTTLTCYNYCDTGHALIACEGVENGRQFLEYFHITITGVSEACGAKVEVKTSYTPSGQAGYTWGKSSEDVQRMRASIKNRQGSLVPFSYAAPLICPMTSPLVRIMRIANFFTFSTTIGYALFGGLYCFTLLLPPAGVSVAAVINFHTYFLAGTVIGGVPLMVANHITDSAVQSLEKKWYQCLKWTVENLREIGCKEIELVSTHATPKDVIEVLRNLAVQQGQRFSKEIIV